MSVIRRISTNTKKFVFDDLLLNKTLVLQKSIRAVIKNLKAISITDIESVVHMLDKKDVKFILVTIEINAILIRIVEFDHQRFIGHRVVVITIIDKTTIFIFSTCLLKMRLVDRSR
jgi:hypothetical protein